MDSADCPSKTCVWGAEVEEDSEVEDSEEEDSEEEDSEGEEVEENCVITGARWNLVVKGDY